MLHYEDSVEFLDRALCSKYTWENPFLEAIAVTFYKNILRIQSLGRLPILLSGVSWVTASYEMEARRQMGLSLDDPRLEPWNSLFDPRLFSVNDSLRSNLQKNWFNRSKRGEVKNGMDIGSYVLGRFASVKEPELSEGLSAVLIGMLTAGTTHEQRACRELCKGRCGWSRRVGACL